MGGGLSIPIAGLLVPEYIFFPAFISVTAGVLIFEAVRLRFPPLNRRFLTCFQALLREGEASTPISSAYLLIAASIAAIALTFVAVGDPVAGMVGGRWGKLKVWGKSLRGSGACFLACLAAGAILASITQVALWVVVIGAVCATLMEIFPLPLNDNLTIPLVAGGVMMLVKVFWL